MSAQYCANIPYFVAAIYKTDHSIVFSALDRSKYIEQLTSKEFDLLVIGGGITGAGIALDAANRGLSVALIEKQDFAAGTSSRSTKLIHGGLRYLKQFEFKLVSEVGKEREIVYKNARHLVVPEKMVLPIIKSGSLGWYSSSFGIYIYDWLAGVERKERRKMYKKDDTLELESLLKQEELLGSAVYTEYRTDDARLTIEVMKTAVEKGSTCLNYMEAEGFIYKGHKLKAIKAIDLITGKEHEIKAKKIVNAAGPWVDKLREKDNSLKGKRLHHTKGVHLVVPYEKFPIKNSMYFDVGDGRMIFTIPREGQTYIGTTDTDYKKELERPAVTKEDVNYLLTAVNRLFAIEPLTPDDVISSWCGLRPLIHEDGKSPSQLSRKDEIFISDSGLISIAGGKLTGYRKMAERVVDLVSNQVCSTDQVGISGGDFSSRKELLEYADNMVDEAKQVCNDPQKIIALVNRYGSNTDIIIKRAYDIFQQTENKEAVIDIAEVWYAVNYEMAGNLCDFLIRRTGRLYFKRQELKENLQIFADAFAQFLGWDEAEKQKQLAEFDKEYKQVLEFV